METDIAHSERWHSLDSEVPHFARMVHSGSGPIRLFGDVSLGLDGLQRAQPVLSPLTLELTCAEQLGLHVHDTGNWQLETNIAVL